MPKKITDLLIRVEGASLSTFPVDMLRYDKAYPYAQHDAAVITEPPECMPSDAPAFKSVEVVVTASGSPSIKRWGSFGWRVTHINLGQGWVPYAGQTVTKYGTGHG